MSKEIRRLTAPPSISTSSSLDLPSISLDLPELLALRRADMLTRARVENRVDSRGEKRGERRGERWGERRGAEEAGPGVGAGAAALSALSRGAGAAAAGTRRGRPRVKLEVGQTAGGEATCATSSTVSTVPLRVCEWVKNVRE